MSNEASHQFFRLNLEVLSSSIGLLKRNPCPITHTHTGNTKWSQWIKDINQKELLTLVTLGRNSAVQDGEGTGGGNGEWAHYLHA